MGTSHRKKDEITLKLCSFNPNYLGFSLFWWVRCIKRLKNVAFQERKGPTLLSLPAKARHPSPSLTAVRGCESWGLTLGHWRPATLTSTLTPKPLQDSRGHPCSGTRGWHLLCSGIHSPLSGLISCICVQTNECVCSFRSPFFYRGELAFATCFITDREVWLTKALLNRAVPLLKFADFH